MRSSMPLKKDISATAVLITQAGAAVSGEEWNEEVSVERGLSLAGAIVNLFVDIRMAPPLIDTSIVPEVPDYLNALFDYGLTLYVLFRRFNLECSWSKWYINAKTSATAWYNSSGIDSFKSNCPNN